MAALTQALVESTLSRSGTRTLGRLSPWSQDTQELTLNLFVLAEVYLQLFASGLGTLALVWATVVLLGGYSTALVRMDFWFTTAIVFVETARIVGYNTAPEAKFFLGVPAAFYHLRHVLWVTASTATNIIGILAMGPVLVTVAPMFLAIACMSLSLTRLLGITNHRRHEYGGPNNGNVKPALILFYSLVLAQGVLFLLWFSVAWNRMGIARTLGSKYLADELLRRKENLENSSSGNKAANKEKDFLIHRYVTSIADTCVQNGVSRTINTTLVSFAEELLLQSQHPDDHISAVSVLHSLVINKNKGRSYAAVDQICASEKLICRLVGMLRSSENLVSISERIEIVRQTKNLDADIKAHIAQIVAKLACKLRLADIPGAAQCISSLLSHSISMKVRKAGRTDDLTPSSTKQKMGWSHPNLTNQRHRPRGGVNRLRTTDTDREKETSKPLFLHGLVILRELAADRENCTEIHNTMDLVPKITAPISSGLLKSIKNDETTVEIVRESLRVMCKLTTSGTEGEKLCHELTTTTKYGSRTAENILWVLSNSSDQEMAERATEILSRLTLSKETMSDFVVVLQRLLMEPHDSPLTLRTEAGKALSALVRSHGDEFRDKFPDIQQMITIMGAADDAYCKEYRVVTAEMLAKFCAKSTADEDRNLLSSVASNALSTVLKAIVTEPGMDRKFLSSFLGLAVQIREKLETAEAFADVVTGLLPMGNNVFAEKLERIIIEMTNDSDDEICLAIMKSTTKLVTWVTGIDTAISPAYLEYFRQVNIVEKLDAAVEAMVHLERYVAMAGGAEEKEGYVTLQTLVETAKNKLVPQQQQQQS